MLAIKRSQREAMGEPAFVDRTIGRLRDYFLDFVYMIEDDELRFRVQHSIEKARSYGLTFESSITTFVLHMLTINPQFDKHPAIQKALLNTQVPVDNRMASMMGCVSDDNWEEAAKQCDAEAYWDRLHEERAKEI